jgi:hypothetical protein
LKAIAIFAVCAVCFCKIASSAPPQLYRQPANESPVRGDPDDLLLLAGYGFSADDVVVYRSVSDTTKPLAHPAQLPSQSTVESGTAAIVSANLPYSLTIKLPAVLRADQSYALWVHTLHGEWSVPVTINDARPLWISPAYVYATASVASLPREVKIIGRNLQPSPQASTQIRLIGPEVVTGTAIMDSKSSAALNHYVARLQLPKRLAPGRYRVQISRDSSSWVEVPNQTLDVRPDSGPPRQYSVSESRFGGCRPDDGKDDTACILNAVAAAKRDGGGTVYFAPGTWNLIDSAQSGVVAHDGIIVAQGVQLRGAGVDLTRLDRYPQWSEHSATVAFTLIGQTVVSGFSFRDRQVYEPQYKGAAFLQLGEDYARVAAASKLGDVVASVNEVIISANTFDKTFIAVGHGGLPINRLFITHNTFGAFKSALDLGGNRFNMTYPFRIDDSVIDHNTFKPGSELDLPGKTGTIASELGAGHRLDFSENVADGASADYLYDPGDARGWRAAFFWAMNGNQEEILVAQNRATCTGDKIGDGEAFSYDNNANTFGLASVSAVAQATSSSISVSAALLPRQNSRDVPVENYYADHWIQIVAGPGVGQVRKIKSYSTDPATHQTTFKVAPDWDVAPVAATSRMAIGREYWQAYTIDNLVDHRQPLCQKSNRSRHDGGGITLWAQSADSVIEGNRQYDADGILVQQNYVLPEHPCADCGMESFFQSFLEIRDNTVDGKYDWDSNCSASGIVTGVAAAPWGGGIPPTVSYGVSISHNTVRHADGARGGGIAQVSSWYAGPEPHRWPLSDNMLIHHNSLRDISGQSALPICGSRVARIGINFPVPQIAWRTVLYGNTCSNVSLPIGGAGVNVTRVCPAPAPNSCECGTAAQ